MYTLRSSGQYPKILSIFLKGWLCTVPKEKDSEDSARIHIVYFTIAVQFLKEEVVRIVRRLPSA